MNMDSERSRVGLIVGGASVGKFDFHANPTMDYNTSVMGSSEVCMDILVAYITSLEDIIIIIARRCGIANALWSEKLNKKRRKKMKRYSVLLCWCNVFFGENDIHNDGCTSDLNRFSTRSDFKWSGKFPEKKKKMIFQQSLLIWTFQRENVFVLITFHVLNTILWAIIFSLFSTWV